MVPTVYIFTLLIPRGRKKKNSLIEMMQCVISMVQYIASISILQKYCRHVYKHHFYLSISMVVYLSCNSIMLNTVCIPPHNHPDGCSMGTCISARCTHSFISYFVQFTCILNNFYTSISLTFCSVCHAVYLLFTIEMSIVVTPT